MLVLVLGARAYAGAPTSVTPLLVPEMPRLGSTAATVPPVAPDLTEYEGKPVRAVELVVDDDAWDDIKAPPLKSTFVGDPFRSDIARAVLVEALASGLFGAAHVNVVPEADGVRIRVHATPRRVIDGLRVELHNAPIDREEVLREAALEDGGELLGSEIAQRKRRIEVLFARRGFPEARVDLSTRQTDVTQHVLLIIDVNAGAPRKVGRRVFYTFGATALELDPYTKGYDVDSGDRVDETALEQADVELGNRLRTAGYYEAAVKHDAVLATYDHGLTIITLRVRIDSGPRFLMRFDGNAHYDADALTTALGIESDPDTGEQHLAEKIRRFYVARAYLDAGVTVSVLGKPTDPTRFVAFHIREGARTYVSARQYPCVREQDIQGLSNGGPSSAGAIGRELDSFLDEDLPGADLIADPDPRIVDKDLGGGSGERPAPVDLDPNATFVPETYDKGVQHLQELYRNEGYLSALVGPVQVLRRRCDPHSPPGRCLPIAFMQALPEACSFDRSGLPLPVASLGATFTCTPDAAHNVECEPAVRLRIPIKLGPRTTLSDMAFFGAKSLSAKDLAEAAALDLGKPVSSLKVDEARRHILERYRDEGFFYADVKYDIERSLDNTRARARFDINEGERVIVSQIIIKGNAITNDSVIRRRIALKVGEPYRASDVRKTQERVATLNVFTSVSVVLQDPQVQQHKKVVIVTVVEKPTQYLEPAIGFSTGEGLRGSLEYGYTNLFGNAWSLVLRTRISYLPDFLISDPTILANFGRLATSSRIAFRVTLSLGLPDIGLGPNVRGNADLVGLQDVERYFIISKFAVLPTVVWRPAREHAFSLTASAEYNILNVFNNQSPQEAALLSTPAGATTPNLDVLRLLRAPNGQSGVLSQRLLWTFDRRDNAFNAHTGTFFSAAAEHVDWFPIGLPPAESSSSFRCFTCAPTFMGGLSQVTQPQSEIIAPSPGHFLKLSGTLSGYFPLPFFKKITFAATLRVGGIIQLTPTSTTYPDRFFFMGGIDSIRSYQQDSMLPQDAVDCINGTAPNCKGNANAINATQIAIRGGNLMINPRVELRIPLTGPIETVIFFDTGNLWQDAGYIFAGGNLNLSFRAAVGSGIRVQTPVGPIALDYGINLTRQSAYEDFGALNFAIGLF